MNLSLTTPWGVSKKNSARDSLDVCFVGSKHDSRVRTDIPLHPLVLILSLIARLFGNLGYRPPRWACVPNPVRREGARYARSRADASNVGPFGPPLVMKEISGPPGACAALPIAAIGSCGGLLSARRYGREYRPECPRPALLRFFGRSELSYPLVG